MRLAWQPWLTHATPPFRLVPFISLDDPVAVGTALTGGPPHRSQRAELPHWAPASGANVEAFVGVGVQDAGGW
jgi:hypothetical protein